VQSRGPGFDTGPALPPRRTAAGPPLPAPPLPRPAALPPPVPALRATAHASPRAAIVGEDGGGKYQGSTNKKCWFNIFEMLVQYIGALVGFGGFIGELLNHLKDI
jgi:hypothetical protein